MEIEPIKYKKTLCVFLTYILMHIFFAAQIGEQVE